MMTSVNARNLALEPLAQLLAACHIVRDVDRDDVARHRQAEP